MIKRLMAKIMQLPFFVKKLRYTKNADIAVDMHYWTHLVYNIRIVTEIPDTLGDDE